MMPVEDSTWRFIHFPIMTQIINGVNKSVFMLDLWGGAAFLFRRAFMPADIMTPHGLLTIAAIGELN